ncbi:hypothetical protein [Gallibacter sp. Marseille-QA0791]|uniref:hypothetical protein n=1 Tax=Gallibacter sp. Marseille-QA0791 TaxID=3378781 RepID=UPI003D096D5E
MRSYKIYVPRNIILISLIIIFIYIAFFFDSCGLFCVTTGLLIIVVGRNSLRNKVFSFFTLCLVICGVYLGIYAFDFIPQAYTLLNINKNVVFWLQSGHIHAIRLLIAYPSYIMSQIFEIELNLAFGYYCAIVFSMLYYYLTLLLELYGNMRKKIDNYVLLIFILLLCAVMNGRISFAFLGFAILLREMTACYCETKPNKWLNRYMKVIIGVVLSAVSSGTMVIAISFTIVMFIMRIIKYKTLGKIHWEAIRLLAICTIFSALLHRGMNYVLFMINKNLTFFDGSVFKLLQHGLGRIFGNISGSIALMVCVFGIVAIIINIIVLLKIYRKQKDTFPLVLGSNMALYGLLAGFSTGSISLVPLVIIILIKGKGEIVMESNAVERIINV